MFMCVCFLHVWLFGFCNVGEFFVFGDLFVFVNFVFFPIWGCLSILVFVFIVLLMLCCFFAF